MAKGKLPAVPGQEPAASPAISEAVLGAGWALLDALPFPVLEIRADYTVARVNPAAARAYGDEGELLATVRPYPLQHRVGSNLVSTHALASGSVLEFHIPLDNNLARDTLTGLYQRDFFDQLVARQVSLLERMDVGYAVALIDLDFFKTVNDSHGRPVGDLLLAAVGQALIGNKRSGDSVARWGGEAFCIFLPGADLGGAHTHAKRVLAAIRDIRLPIEGGDDLHITASIGVAMAMPKDAFATVVKRADQALCKAKETGRDQIKLADGP